MLLAPVAATTAQGDSEEKEIQIFRGARTQPRGKLEKRDKGRGGTDESGWLERGALHYFKKPVPRCGGRSAKEANEWRAATK